MYVEIAFVLCSTSFFPRDTWTASKPLGKFIKIDMGAEGVEVNGGSEEENGTLRWGLCRDKVVIKKKEIKKKERVQGVKVAGSRRDSTLRSRRTAEKCSCIQSCLLLGNFSC